VLPANCTAHRQLRAESVELRALVSRANLLVLPTRADCSSLAALEAAACGVPAVISRTGGIPDLVETGVTGTLLSRADAAELRQSLEPYRKDSALATQQGQSARRVVEKLFSRTAHLETLRTALSRAGVSS
jgi:glycosyltransferase involved in cell wall biosynthesis